MPFPPLLSSLVIAIPFIVMSKPLLEDGKQTEDEPCDLGKRELECGNGSLK